MIQLCFDPQQGDVTIIIFLADAHKATRYYQLYIPHHNVKVFQMYMSEQLKILLY